ncbi:MAG: Acetoin:2,6-dichlorophenolindophenol oxidoreductase subunit alpha [Syntrophomonadaceae bacterium]|nr:Acetoin:2,6-dichlorophenolindophenol oxidoreductase subunit alpha [Bacillota bacterium]MBT9146992.1 Acetoin:2,6-dichlorophenolindophenol oxidoreductase subunit alpha [Bacillota bacterium]
MKAETLKRLYYQMLRIRMIEEKIAELYPEQEMRCPVHLCIGQEAVAAGVCANLSHDDYVLSNHRSHGHYLAKGGDLKAMMAEFYGKVTGCSKGKGGSMHLVDLSVGFLGATPIVGSTIPIAVGTAFGSVMRGETRVSVIFFGDAAPEEGVFHESLNFAMLKRLPVVFVCENNFYSVYSPLSVRQPEGREIFELAKGHGIESYQGDGNDVVEVYQLAERAVRKARHGGGPTFLEFKTYRWREHCGPYYDNDLGYRAESEFQEWRRRCPIETLKERLLSSGVLCNQDIHDMVSDLDAEMEDAIVFAKESPLPEEQLLLEHIYAP